MRPDLLARSDRLHARVRAFARRETSESFDELAIAIARFQAKHSPGFARLSTAYRSRLDRVDSIPAVPAEAFRIARVAVHPPELDAVRFQTSGTTGGAPGIHAMRTTDTYRELSVRHGKQALVSDAVVVALAPPPGPEPRSSLGFMMQAFMQELDAEPRAPLDRWLASEAGIDRAGLERAAAVARERRRPLLLLTTSFALVALLDALDGATVATPAGSLVMQTGGFKGRTRELPPGELRARTARAFGITEAQIVGEYGMTELTSQLYEAEPGLYVAPPWLEAVPVDPVTLERLPEGEVGIARFVDLGNVDSAVAIVTEDRIRRRAGGIELLGRAAGAVERGCSLAAEALLLP
jgi:hypothetical protein